MTLILKRALHHWAQDLVLFRNPLLWFGSVSALRGDAFWNVTCLVRTVTSNHSRSTTFVFFPPLQQLKKGKERI